MIKGTLYGTAPDVVSGELAKEAKIEAILATLTFEELADIVEQNYTIWHAVRKEPFPPSMAAQLEKARKTAKGSKAAYSAMIDDVADHELLYGQLLEIDAKKKKEQQQTVCPKSPSPFMLK